MSCARARVRESCVHISVLVQPDTFVTIDTGVHVCDVCVCVCVWEEEKGSGEGGGGGSPHVVFQVHPEFPRCYFLLGCLCSSGPITCCD